MFYFKDSTYLIARYGLWLLIWTAKCCWRTHTPTYMYTCARTPTYMYTCAHTHTYSH